MSEVRRTELRRPEKLPEGLDALVHRGHGVWRRRRSRFQALLEMAGFIEASAAEMKDLSPHDLEERLREGRELVLRRGRRNEDVFAKVFPAIAETARRELGMTPYREQILGALALSHGYLSEMATGEGKTLTIALAAAAYGWTGLPCHVITANDYLAERDATELKGFYKACGLRSAHISGRMSAGERSSAYAAGVVYTTSKELVADFLRDRLQLGPLADPGRRMVDRFLRPRAVPMPLVQRGLHTVIVDEADNQMIDEAVTPLIISRPQENQTMVEASRLADRIAGSLLVGEDYELDYTYKDVRLLPDGRDKVAAWCAENAAGLYSQPAWMGTLVLQALQARHFFLRDKQYVVMDGEVIIVDEFTGRLMPGRNWRLGLHQAVEAKEGIAISQPSENLAQLSFQRFFRVCSRLSGITGTAAEASDEFWSIYELPLLTVPPHRPCVREVWPTRYFADAASKWEAVVEQIVALHAQGRPIMAGTRSVAASEHLGRLLNARSLTFTILNAIRHQEEAAVVSLAGERNAITIATNMAGRGTDIRLGEGIARAGGLHVILTELHESGRIDRQLQGRAARQGDPGSTCTFVSMEDELADRFLPRFARRAIETALRKERRGSRRAARWAMAYAQRRAEKMAFHQRRGVMAQDRMLSENLLTGQAIDRI